MIFQLSSITPLSVLLTLTMNTSTCTCIERHTLRLLANHSIFVVNMAVNTVVPHHSYFL